MGHLKALSRQVTLTFAGLVALLLIAGPLPARAHDVTDENIAEKVAAASTSEDHLALAAYYRGLADSSEAKIASHEKMRAMLSTGKPSNAWGPHCNGLIASYKSVKKDAEEMAREQEALAKGTGK